MEKVLEVSKLIWKATQEENIEVLKNYTHPETVFVHMGVTLGRDDELNVIKNKMIVYKHVDVEETSVRQMESTAIVLTKMKLTAVVGGNEVVNPFVVTEAYTIDQDEIKLASLSYTRINY